MKWEYGAQFTEGIKRKSIKQQKPYERFGEVIRYLTQDELKQFFDHIEDYKHKLMFQVIYELGCRVGEFVRIQVKHVNFGRSTIFLPAENTKTKHARTSHLPRGLTNEIRSLLKEKGFVSKRNNKTKKPESYLLLQRHFSSRI